MKTFVYLLTFYFVLIVNTNSGLSQEIEFQSQQANKYMNQFDSLYLQNSQKNDSALRLRNNNVDSMIQAKVNCTENRIYLADSNALQNHSEIEGMLQLMEMEMISVQTQMQNRIDTQKQEMDSCVNQVKNKFMYKLQELDSLAYQYEYMLNNQEEYGDSLLNAMKAQIQEQCQKLDSMLQKQDGNCNEFRKMLDSIIDEGQLKLDSMLQKNQGEIDSLLGIKSQTRFRLTHNSENPNDTLGNKNKHKFSEIVEEVILIDTTDIRIKFTKKIAESQEIKNLFKIHQVDLLKSTSAEDIEIVDVYWSDQKADVLQLIIDVPLYNADLIEIEFNGEIELNSDDELLLMASSEVNEIQNNSAENNFIVYPNPAQEYIQISNSENIQHITIYNLNGSKFIELSKPFDNINLLNLNSGIYFINILDNSGNTHSRKLIKR